MGWRRMTLLSGWHIIFLRLMFCIRSGKATAEPEEFIRCLALHNRYVINFVDAGKDEMLEASRGVFPLRVWSNGEAVQKIL